MIISENRYRLFWRFGVPMEFARSPMGISNPPHWLPRTRMLGGQHADKSADIGVPNIAIAIDGDAERPGIVAGKRKDLDVAVAQPPEARAAHHAEPDVVIWSHGNAAETGIFPTGLYIRELSILESPDAIGSKLQKPHRAVGADRNVSRHGAAALEVECSAGPVG